MSAPTEKYGDRRMLLAPRTHGKSTVANLADTLWELLHNPDLRFLICSKTDGQALAFVKHCKLVLEHERFVFFFGDLRGDRWTGHELSVAGGTKASKEANILALGVGSALPGRHFDRVKLDDVIDETNCGTETARDHVRSWYYQTLEPAVTKAGRIDVIGTRWHYFDLYGELIEQGGFTLRHYRAIIQPSNRVDLWDEYAALATSIDEDQRKEAVGFLSWNWAAMHDGVEVLLPDVWSYAALMVKKAKSGSLIFSRQYQNTPKLGEGDEVFKPDDLKYYVPNELPDLWFKVSYYDLAISLKESADFFAGVTLGVSRDGRFYVLDFVRGHLSFPQQEHTIEERNDRWDEVIVGIESVQYQAALAQSLRAKTGVPVREVPSPRDKMTRAMRVQGLVESHRVHFNKRHAAVIQELLEFPYSEHDDLFDAVVGALSLASKELRRRVRSGGESGDGRPTRGRRYA